MSLLSTCTHFREHARYKNSKRFLSYYTDLNNTSPKPGVFWTANNITLLSLKHSCPLEVEVEW